MAGALGSIARMGLTLTAARIRSAVGQYVDDRMTKGRATATSFAAAAGFYAAAGIFVINAILVGIGALGYWMVQKYGVWYAVGAAGGALLVLALICLLIARAKLKPASPVRDLSDRLRIAVDPPQLRSAPQNAKASSADAANRAVSSSPARKLPKSRPVQLPSGVIVKTSAAVATGLIGWALARRFGLDAKPAPSPQPAKARRRA